MGQLLTSVKMNLVDPLINIYIHQLIYRYRYIYIYEMVSQFSIINPKINTYTHTYIYFSAN